MKTFSIKAGQINKKWYVINAENAVPGRLAAIVAGKLRGKHKPEFTPHMDCGDNIIIVNARKVRFTGKKYHDKIYYWHTGYPGGIKSKTAKDILNGKQPHQVLQKSIERMMPGGPLSRKQLKNLFVYSGEGHPHQAQNPQSIDIQKLNQKNINKQEIRK